MENTHPQPPYLLVRRPAASLADGIVTFREREPVDLAAARRQWEAYVEAFRSRGWGIVEVPVADDLPDSVFVEDTVVMFGERAVLTNPKQPTRNPETGSVAQVLEELGIPYDRIAAPGTLDGGDVLKVGSTVYVGLSGTTNAEGIAQLAGFVEPHGYRVVTVPLTKALHLKSAVTALPDGTVIGYAPVVDDPDAFESFLPVPEESGAHVVLSGDTLIMAADAPESAALLRERGWDVVEVDVGEYEKLEGCVTCLSVRVR
ncbi:N(G),N(G)-dimethylarginine dimethylaminohydrolase [Brevibacterium sp. 5221]|uniref:N(G),N(G)-dimethylarginine dimethylaminohydrolase n=1 Tax=Brevibacterium rongguiense TaxID=2695267 RepID=A0A6N9H469_9MICO|nr:dimethylargininase [Brevibacterium rongguiense]MYM18810.1 N(G),N(G)-dimethylarginine dimethylaminohydrolase [Brevibacterium rongguiense]